MHTLPVATPSPTNSPSSSEKTLGEQNQVTPVEEDAMEDTKSSQPEEVEITTFKYKPRASVLSKSFRGLEPPSSRHTATAYKSDGESNTISDPNQSSEPVAKDENGSGSSGGMRQSSSSSIITEESSTSSLTEGSKTEVGVLEGKSREKLTTKNHPYSRRIDITPRASSPCMQKSRPKILPYGKSDKEARTAKSGPAMLVRRSTLASIPTGRRLLPAPPKRRGSRTVTHASSSSPSSEKSASPKNSTNTDSVNSFATKLVNLLEDVSAKDSTVTENRESGIHGEACLHPTPAESSSSVNSKEDQKGEEPKVKHTVQYKSSAISKRGKCDYTIVEPNFNPLK